MFPKCMVGRLPFVNCHGNLMPCCWIDSPRYNTKGKVLNNKAKWVQNIFLDPKFDLNLRPYKEVIQSDDWNLALEKLFLVQYYNCSKKCGDFLVVDDKITYNEYEIDDMIREQRAVRLKDVEIFNANLVDPWDINEIQLELTNKCSLKCFYCARFRDKPSKSDLDIKVVEQILTCKKWNDVADVGSYGDTMFYKPYHDFLRILMDSDVGWYGGHFAATGKGKKWWDETISLYEKVIASGTGVRMTFGIDGLEDTSKLHRVGQDWDEITYALKRCVEIGCKVQWQFIAMSFNEHQIDEAKKLAEDWGCDFHITLSSRFRKNDPNRPKSTNLYRSTHV